MHFNKIRYKKDYYQPHKIIRHVLIYLLKRRGKNSKITKHEFQIAYFIFQLHWSDYGEQNRFFIWGWHLIGSKGLRRQSLWSTRTHFESEFNNFKGFNVGRTTRHLGNICDQKIVPLDLVNLCRRESLRRIRNQRFVNQQGRMSSYSLFY